jgi:hypothetical protein
MALHGGDRSTCSTTSSSSIRASELLEPRGRRRLIGLVGDLARHDIEDDLSTSTPSTVSTLTHRG